MLQKIIFFLLIFPLSFVYSFGDELKKFQETDSVYCEHVIRCGSDYIAIYSYGEMNEEKYNYSGWVVAFDNEKKIIDYKEIIFKRYKHNYLYFDNENVVLRINIADTSTPHFLVFSHENQKIEIISSDLPWVGQFMLYNNKLYYSSYKGAPNINYIDLLTNVRFAFNDYYIPGACFIVSDKIVYAVNNSRYPNTSIRICEDGVEEVDKFFNEIDNNIRLSEYDSEMYVPIEALHY